VFPLKDNIPTSGFPIVTVALIAANVLMYFIFQHGTITLGDPSSPAYTSNLFQYAFYPYELTHWGQQCAQEGSSIVCGTPRPGSHFPPTGETVFTAMFMHGGLLHLGGNMLFLWIFGNNVEDSMGPVKFIAFYLLGGLAATAGQTLVDPNAAVPNIGASGAVAGVLGGYLLLFPRARVVTLIFIVFFFTITELPAMLFLVIWFAQQALFGYFGLINPGGGGGGVAYFAHIGGFAFGLIAIKLFASERRRRRQIEQVGLT
jgi:membrane associated rhomboid family serine protease